jgi:N6-adenosine-specific RNA methylase IME4
MSFAFTRPSQVEVSRFSSSEVTRKCTFEWRTMETKVACVNHAALVNGYYAGQLRLREGSLQIASAAFIRPATAGAAAEMSAAAARRQRKREMAARRRTERLEELVAQGKFVPLSGRVRSALQNAHERFSGPRFELRRFLPSFKDEVNADALVSLPKLPNSDSLDDGKVHCNDAEQVRVADANGVQVVVPAGSIFAQRDVRELHQLALGRHKLIMMDPPWQNKSVSRGKRYNMFDHTELLKIDVPSIADLDECVLAVWVTNRPRYLVYLREHALPSWGFTFHACWYWLKLSKNGELVTPLDSTHRLPVETLVVAYRAEDALHEQRVRQRLGEQVRIVLSIPLRHSWKPPPESFFDESIVSATDKKAELFARELRPHWTSVGNEVCTLAVDDALAPAKLLFCCAYRCSSFKNSTFSSQLKRAEYGTFARLKQECKACKAVVCGFGVEEESPLAEFWANDVKLVAPCSYGFRRRWSKWSLTCPSTSELSSQKPHWCSSLCAIP